MDESIKALVEANMFRGSYVTADEKPIESPLQFILWLADRQVNRTNNQLQVQEATTGDL